MDYKQQAVEDLKRHGLRLQAVRNLQERIEVLQAKFEGAYGPRLDGVPMKGGGNAREERMVANIAKRDELQQALAQSRRMVALVQRGLRALPKDQRRVLEVFYLQPGHGKAEQLCEQLGVERATVYRLRDKALRNFTLVMYGKDSQ